jgi:hypothetical protein
MFQSVVTVTVGRVFVMHQKGWDGSPPIAMDLESYGFIVPGFKRCEGG